MATNFPYVNTIGPLHQFLKKLRTRFPDVVTVDTLKKQGIAAKNETYIINTLRFLDLIDDEGNKNKERARFFQAGDPEYSVGMEEAVKHAYDDLFDTNGDATWGMSKPELVTFFRMSDDTSEIVGQRQASTFLALAAEAGHGDIPDVKVATAPNSTTKKKTKGSKKKKVVSSDPSVTLDGACGGGKQNPLGDMSFSLRIEMNLPTTDDKSVYDALFTSIRENLIEPHTNN